MSIKKLIKFTSIVLCICCIPIMQSVNALDYIHDRYLSYTFFPEDEISSGGGERALLEKVLLNTPNDEKIQGQLE